MNAQAFIFGMASAVVVSMLVATNTALGQGVGSWKIGVASASPTADEPRAADLPGPMSVSERLRPFDSQDYTLAFDALLGAGDLQRAFRVAQAAVQSAPQDRAWRLKLARVSLWVQRPEVAAEQWMALFQQGDQSSETVAKVIQLAPLAGQPLLALQGWVVYARQHRLTDAQWQDVYNLYESAAEPRQGAAFFEAQYLKNRHPLLLHYAARLADNAGDDARAERLYLQRAALQPFSLDSVLRAVVYQIRHDKMAQALVLMKAHQAEVPADAAAFWQLLGQVAWELRDENAAQTGYERYARSPGAVAADWSRLVFLVRRQHPEQAAELALDAYRRFNALDMLLFGMGIYSELGNLPAQARIFSELGDKAETMANTETRFLVLRAQFYQKQNKTDLAWADLRRALIARPNDSDLVLTSLWLLIDSRRLLDLDGLLRLHIRMAPTEPQLWPAYAAASQVLERHRDAVRWYGRMVQAKTDDPLTLLNYADALERTNQAGMADRMRRHAWLQLTFRVKDPTALRKPGENADLLALARLSLMNQPGDPGLALVRQMVEQLRDVPDAQQNEQTLSLVLGWAILKEQYGDAQSWMWRSYARQAQRSAPLWGESQVALQLNDTRAMTRLLAQQTEALPIYNRYDTSYALGHVAQAQDIAFNGMAAQDDEPLYDRYRQHVPLEANYVQAQSEVDHGSQLASHGLRFETRLAITPQLHLVLGSARLKQNADEPVLAAIAPQSDRLVRAELQWLGERGQTSLALFQRDELVEVTGFRLNQTYAWGDRLGLEGGLNYRADSSLSEPMQVAGYENSAFASVNYTLGRREYLRATARLTRYATQWRDNLGNGQALELEAGYRVRTEYPDWRVRTFLTRQLFSRAAGLSAQAQTRLPQTVQDAINAGALDPVGYFIPESSTTWGVCLDMGENIGGQSLQTTYSRAWRPFVDLCLNHNTLTGAGVSGVLGVAGAVTGEDHLRMQFEHSDGSSPGSSPVTRLAVRYRHYF